MYATTCLRKSVSSRIAIRCAAGMLLALSGCEQKEKEGLSGTVRIDGSSTVAPISMVAAELFGQENPNVRVTVGISGTGGGFKKFLDPNHDLRTDINDASRPIKAKEMEKATEAGIEFIELPLAIDGIAVVVNPSNTFCDHLTVAELKHIWKPGSEISNWKDVRDGFPDLRLKLYGPGTDSGTFDYFTKAIVGKEKASRSDFTMSEDDNVLVLGVHGDPGGLGYFGFSYYEANKGKLKLLAIDNDDGKPVKPSLDVIRSGAYKPLSRPLFLYVNKAAAQRPEVGTFLRFYYAHARTIVEHPQVNYVALSEALYGAAVGRLSKGITGSAIAEAKGGGPLDLAKLYVGK